MEVVRPDGTKIACVLNVDEDGTPIPAPGQQRELVVTTYVAINAFVGASSGDTITSTRVINLTTDPPTTESVVWRNESTGVDLIGAPSASDIDLVGAGALTDAQLRASPVPISASALPLPTGATTELTVAGIAASQTSGAQKTQIVSGANTLAVSSTGQAQVNLSQVGGTSIALGPALSVASFPVVLASDQPAIATTATVSGTVAVSSIAGNVATTNAVLSQVDGHSATLGATGDPESAAGNSGVIGLLKRLRTLLAAGLPTSLTVAGNLKVAIVEATASLVSDITDRANRLVGIVYGSQSQQIKQTPVYFNSAVELYSGANAYDARQTRALTAADVVTVVQPVGTSLNVASDVSDRAARLLGVVYGSQGTQLQQSTTGNNLYSELRSGNTSYDARQIRALISSDVVTVVQPTGAQLNTVSDVSDRPTRTLGITYGSQGAQLQQSATNNNLLVELKTGATAYDARQTRNLSSVTDSVAVVFGAGTATATDATIAYSTTSVTLRASNSARTGLYVQNNGTTNAHIAFGQTATTAHPTIEVGGRYEMPSRYFTGQINIIWDAGGAGSALVTEIA